MVSRIGALPTASLCPRLCSSSPEVSMLIVQRSSSMRDLDDELGVRLMRRAEFLADCRAIRCAAAPE